MSSDMRGRLIRSNAFCSSPLDCMVDTGLWDEIGSSVSTVRDVLSPLSDKLRSIEFWALSGRSSRSGSGVSSVSSDSERVTRMSAPSVRLNCRTRATFWLIGAELDPELGGESAAATWSGLDPSRTLCRDLSFCASYSLRLIAPLLIGVHGVEGFGPLSAPADANMSLTLPSSWFALVDL
jgi:hypothetical protein